jgi:hypothetical protein
VERLALVKNLKRDILASDLALAIANSKPASDASRAKEIETATNQRAAAQVALERTKTSMADPAQSDSYMPLSPQYPQTSTGRRKALAQWMTSRDNPLTARVAVNQIWSRHFHAPLVETVYDFGRNGARPAHPELLDYLAIELMDSGWSMKHLHRLIVTSVAYQRASSVGSAAEEAKRDPENKLLWRMNAGRMEAEVVRDSLLYAAGKLDLKQGGQELENSEALVTNRRSLYYSTYPEAGGKSELGQLFDGPEPLECYRRTRSIIPQQALALTNSELVHQVSSTLAAKLWSVVEQTDKEGSARMQAFIASAFESVLSRAPKDTEVASCEAFLSRQAGPNPTEERQVLARTSLVRALLNHNDFVTIR